jgi:hypothetical protein
MTKRPYSKSGGVKFPSDTLTIGAFRAIAGDTNELFGFKNADETAKQACEKLGHMINCERLLASSRTRTPHPLSPLADEREGLRRALNDCYRFFGISTGRAMTDELLKQFDLNEQTHTR